MSQTPIEALLAQDRRIVAAALAAMVVLAWLYLFRLAGGTGAMELAPWGLAEWVLTSLMWAVMMIGMMIPSAAPMILLFAGLRRRKRPRAALGGEIAVFMSGYILVWTGFSVAATALQWSLEQAALLSPMMVSLSPQLNGAILIAAGIYQWLPIKDVCLRQCRDPARFLSEHWRPGTAGALGMGLRHGLFCLGCCWVLMALLFVGGVMNLVWIALIAGLVLIEKLAPRGARLGRLGGLGLAAAGLAIAAT